VIDSLDLERIFELCFESEFQTILVGGASEPLYRPSENEKVSPHRVIYREDFFASALHEVAHWCLAGRRRRRLEDYGYWYRPDGRSAQEQEDFEKVEVDPQAIEWIFSDACDFAFNLSADNLRGATGSSSKFKEAVASRKRNFLAGALPARADAFCSALSRTRSALALVGPACSRS
jgi:elongation factor P hydroxylase